MKRIIINLGAFIFGGILAFLIYFIDYNAEPKPNTQTDKNHYSVIPDTIIIDTTITKLLEEGNYKYYRLVINRTNQESMKVIYCVNDSLSVNEIIKN